MKASRLVELGSPLVINDVPEPNPGPGDAVVKVEFEGICRTDWHIWQGDWSWVGLAPALPITMGHEFSGAVVEVGQRGDHDQGGRPGCRPVPRGVRTLLLLPCRPVEPVRRAGVPRHDP